MTVDGIMFECVIAYVMWRTVCAIDGHANGYSGQTIQPSYNIGYLQPESQTQKELPPGFLEPQPMQNGGMVYQGNSQRNKVATDDILVQQAPMFSAQAVNLNANVQQDGGSNYADGTTVKNLSANSRIGFIRKVYTILSIQILITTIFVVATFVSPELRLFMKRTPALIYICLVVYMVSLYSLACYPKVARSVPTNYILLFIFTVSFSYVIAFISAQYDFRIVTSSAIMTLLVVVGLTAYAFYTKTDFTMLGGLLFSMTLLLIGMIILGIFITSKFYHTVIAAAILVLFSVYLIYDTQLIIGKKSNKYLIDDYILAAVNLHLDIINIFLALMQLIGSATS